VAEGRSVQVRELGVLDAFENTKLKTERHYGLLNVWQYVGASSSDKRINASGNAGLGLTIKIHARFY
jgi:hypothetical protein